MRGRTLRSAAVDLKAIVIACNTVSSVALDLLTEENNIPIIGTVEPAADAR